MTVECKLIDSLDVLLKLAYTVHHFEDQDVLYKHLNRLASLLAETGNLLTDETNSNLLDIQIPSQIIDLVDNGMNPDLFIKDLLHSLMIRNQHTNGRIQSIKLLKDELEAILDEFK